MMARNNFARGRNASTTGRAGKGNFGCERPQMTDMYMVDDILRAR